MSQELRGFIVRINDEQEEEDRARISDAIFHIKGVANITPIGRKFDVYNIQAECERKVREKIYEALQ